MIQVGTGLLYPALRKAGVTIGPGRMPSPAQFDDSLGELNRLVGSLNCDPLWVYSQDVQTFALTASKGVYTMGKDATSVTTADFDVARPQWISAANVLQGTLRAPLAILTPQQWADVAQQTLDGFPEAIYNDRASPLSNVYLTPRPSSSMTLELYTWHLAGSATTVNDVVQLPPGYEDAIVLNLAVRLAPHFQRPVDPSVRADARESLMRLLSLNAPKPILEVGDIGACGSGGWNIYTDG